MTPKSRQQGPQFTDRERRAIRRRMLLVLVGPIGFLSFDVGVLVWIFGGSDSHAIGVAATGYGGGALLSIGAIHLYDHLRGR